NRLHGTRGSGPPPFRSRSCRLLQIVTHPGSRLPTPAGIFRVSARPPSLPVDARYASRRRTYPPALPQLVAIDDCALSARHVVEDAALDKRVFARVAEQDQRRTIVIAARIARDLPSLREQLLDR